MRTIYKYKIGDGISHGRCEILVPRGAKLLSVGLDPNDRLCAWFLVDTTELETKRFGFNVYYTGEEVWEEKEQHYATIRRDSIVYHIFPHP